MKNKNGINLINKRNILILSIILALLIGLGGYYFYQNREFNKNEDNDITVDDSPSDMNEEPRKSETDTPKNNTKPSNNGNKNTNTNKNNNKNDNNNTNTDKKNQEVEIPKEDSKKNTDVDVPKENQNSDKQTEVPKEDNTGKQETQTPTQGNNTGTTNTNTNQTNTNSSENKDKNQGDNNGSSQSGTNGTTGNSGSGDDPGNTMTVQNYCIHSEAAYNATELRFVKMTDSEINRRYNAATARDVIRWVGDGKIKTWTENKIIYVASPKKIYFVDGSWLKNNSVYLGGINMTFGNGDTEYIENYKEGCGFGNLRIIDFANVDTSKMTYMGSMFANAILLEEIKNLTNFNTSNVTSMDMMFSGCKRLKSVDLSSFNTSKVKSMDRMFFYNTKLEKIYISNKWSTVSLKYNNNIFGYEGGRTLSLKGGNGTACISTTMDTKAAKADLPGSPGCLTLKK